jgi:hypothetical protein
MSRKTRKYVTGLNLVPLSDVTNNGYEPPRVLAARLRREEQEAQIAATKAAEEKLMAPVRAAEKQFKQAASEHSAKIRFYFSKSPSVILENIENAPVDAYGDYPLLEGTRDLQADNSVREEFRQNLASSGCILNDAGQTRLDVYLDVLNYYRNVSLTSVTSWAIGLERLNALGCFQPGELSGYDNAVAREEARKPTPVTPEISGPTMEDLMSLDATTREGFKDAQKIAQDLGQLEARPLWQAWAKSLADNFSLYTTPEDRERIKEWFKRNNRSWSDHSGRAFNDCRKYMVKQGFWPESCLTKDELLARETENVSLQDFQSRRDLKRRLVEQRAN